MTATPSDTTKTAPRVRRKRLPQEGFRAIELFAGVGGFRLGLERAGWSVVWSNQYEPATTAQHQHASDTYERKFGEAGHTRKDIAKVLDDVGNEKEFLPQHDLLVGGFPCQDYSVAKTLSQASGLVGKKGVLWWEIFRALEIRHPRYIFLENVDRLLKSPASQRGRDFAIMLSSLAGLGYRVEWRVINAAEYGFPQRRRRVFIVGELIATPFSNPLEWILNTGVIAQAMPVQQADVNGKVPDVVELFLDTPDVETKSFGVGAKSSPFENSGVMYNYQVWTAKVLPKYRGKKRTLGGVLEPDGPDGKVPAEFFIPEAQVGAWEYLKGSKSEPRMHKASGFEYLYKEGPVQFPDLHGWASRTVLTGEGGPSPSRFKHVVRASDGRLRRLMPVELERLNGFPDQWTAGHSDSKRAFLMGNALVVGVVERIARSLKRHALTQI